MREAARVVAAPPGPDDMTWDPQAREVLLDQRRAYDELRERCPVAHSAVMGWSLFRHADVTAVTGDPASFSSATKRLAIPNGMDPPEHTRYRGSLEPYFTPDRLATFEPRSRQLARDLLRGIGDTADVEAIGQFVDPFAHQALCAFMGWPVEDWNRISGWTHGNLEAAFRSDREAGARLAHEFATYVTEILEARRAEDSADDLMGDLVHVTVHDRPLSDDQIVGLLRTWTAGHGTVAAALGIVVAHLADDVELQALLRREPELIQPAIWEILRSDGPLVSNSRTATRNVEIGGHVINAGERISLMWIAANRDPDAFPDAEEVRLDRGNDDNLLFGAGIHRCLGAPLAILNMRAAITELLAQTAWVAADAPETAVGLPRSVYPGNGLRKLHVRFRPAAVGGR
jgi:cytochrome P450